MAVFSDLTLLIASPSAFFDALSKRDARSSWLPLAIQITAAALLFYAYYHLVNFPWLHEQLLADVPNEQRAKAERLLSLRFLTASSITSTVIAIPATTALVAVYFFLVGRLQNSSKRLGQWFLMSSWAGIVSALTLPIGLVTIFLSGDGRVRPEELNPITLNQLLLHLDMTSRWGTFAEATNALIIIEIVLLGVGYARFAQTSVFKGLILASLPFSTIYAVWALILMASGSV